MMLTVWSRIFHLASGGLALLALPLVVAAQQADDAGTFSLHGFGTLGVARASNGRAEIARDLSQPDGVSDHWSGKIDSNLGVQANYLVNDTVEAVVQAVSRYSHRGNFAPQITEALLKYDPSPYLSVRAGRVSTDFFMHGDSRLIGYSQLSVRPNIDYYSSLAISFLDGADAQVTAPIGDGLLRGKGYIGFLGEKLPFGGGYLDLRGSRAMGAYLDYQEGGWQWRGGVAQIRFRHRMPDAVGELQEDLRNTAQPAARDAADAFDLQGTRAHYYSAGVVYDRGPFMAQLMLGRLSYEMDAMQDQDALMFLTGYRVGEFKPFAGYSRTRTRSARVSSGLPDSGSSAAINARLASMLAESGMDQHTYTLGMRWDFRRDMALKAQLDMIRGKPDSLYTFRNEMPGWNGRTNVVTLTLDFIF